MSTLLTVTLLGALFSAANTTLIWAVLKHHRRAVKEIQEGERYWQRHVTESLQMPPFDLEKVDKDL